MANLEARALDWFDHHADMAPQARAEHLCALHQTDPELHAEVARLFKADALQGALLQSPQKILSVCGATSEHDEADDPRIGSTLGAWRIEGVIGSGGMGRVYRASRADGQYAQVVALKCVSVKATSPVLAEVIRNERDVLALLEHPNIATLLDGGVDATGCPWFAMQLVQGEAIDLWCDHHRLDIRARVALFVQLCEGLRYAHGKGALHSDLKPSNVLVDEAGRPVLLDFGLSSLTARSHGGTQRRVAMSFGYTAPEVAAEGYSVASDIYALGVMLCGLLCGAQPQVPDSALPDVAPSLPFPGHHARGASLQVAQARGMKSTAALSRVLGGDLDRIVAACVARDPAQRPASVAQLQADLRAWLDMRPITERQQEAGYRLRLFLRRHRIGAAVAALVLIGGGVGLATGIRLHGQASEQAQAAQAMRRLFDSSFDALTTGGLGQSPLMSVAMLRDAEANLRGDAAAGRVDADVTSLVLMALARSYTTLGNYRHAMELLEETQTQSAAREDRRAPIQAAMAHLLNIQSRHPQARDAVREGLAHIDAVPATERDLARLTLEVELARAQWGMAQIDEGRATLQQALAHAEDFAAHDPRPLAALLIQEGQWLRLFSGHEAAKVDFERAIALTRQRAPIIADEATVDLIHTLNQQGQHARAVELGTALLERRRQMLGEEHPETGKAWAVLGNSHFWNGQADIAQEFVQRSVDILSAALGEDHPETARATLVRGAIHSHLGRAEEAVANGRRALSIMQQAYGPKHQESMRAMGYLAAALAVSASSRPDAAKAWDEVVDLFARRVGLGQSQGLPMLSERMVLIKAKLRLGLVDEAAQEELEDIIAALSEAMGATNDAVQSARFTLIEVVLKLGKEDLGRTLLETLLRDVSTLPVTMVTESMRISCHEKLGDLANAHGAADTAREHWQQAHNIAMRIELGQPNAQRLENKLASIK